MPEVEHTACVRAPLDAVWAFVQDMDNWAEYVTGYQSHTILSETDSAWKLKGDLGAFTRLVELEVRITEWNGPERVSFTLRGINEPVEGSGSFRASARSGVPEAKTGPLTSLRGALRRLRRALARFLLARIFGPARHREGASERSGNNPGESEITFRLAVNAGGRAGPMINAMIAPLMEPAAEELAERIARRIEELRAPSDGRDTSGPSSGQ